MAPFLSTFFSFLVLARGVDLVIGRDADASNEDKNNHRANQQRAYRPRQVVDIFDVVLLLFTLPEKKKMGIDSPSLIGERGAQVGVAIMGLEPEPRFAVLL